MRVHRKFVWAILSVCAVGCSPERTETGAPPTAYDELGGPAITHIVGDVKVSLLNADGAPAIDAIVPLQRKFAIGGTFRALGEFANVEFQNQVFYVYLMRRTEIEKQRRGERFLEHG